MHARFQDLGLPTVAVVMEFQPSLAVCEQTSEMKDGRLRGHAKDMPPWIRLCFAA